METHWLSGKEKVTGAVVRKDYTDGLLGKKGPISIDFLEKSASVNSASYCQNSAYLLNEFCISFNVLIHKSYLPTLR